MDKKIKAIVSFTFTGEVDIVASSKEEAKRIIENDFAMVCGRINTSNDEAVRDWDFPTHPDKTIKSIKII